MSKLLGSLFWLTVCTGGGFALFAVLAPTPDALKKRIGYVDHYTVDMRAKKKEEQKLRNDFSRVIQGTVNSPDTIYGAASAKAQGLNPKP